VSEQTDQELGSNGSYAQFGIIAVLLFLSVSCEHLDQSINVWLKVAPRLLDSAREYVLSLVHFALPVTAILKFLRQRQML
jgi:hypothetical protein